MTIGGWVDISRFELNPGDDAETWFRRWQGRIGSDGRGAFVFHLGQLGTPRDQMPLTVFVDFDAGRAAVRWRGVWGVESAVPDFHHPLELEDGDADVTVPTWAARVTPATARRVVTDFAATGEQPRGLTWIDAQ